MLHKTKYFLASTALLACMLQSAPSFSDTTVQETDTTGPGSTMEKKTVTETTPNSTSVSTTVTTDKVGTDGTETHWQTEEHNTISDTHVINLMDYSNAGVLSTDEVGRMLFKIFDTDGNGVIDSNEYEHHVIVTILPMEKNTVVTYKLDHDGETQTTTTTTTNTYDTFMQGTRLINFNNNSKGISPHEFTGMDFLAADVNRDHAIDLKEWQGTYNASIDKANKDKANLNK